MRIRQIVLLSAFLLTDGGISSKGKNWLIYFRNKDQKIIQKFQESLKGLIGKSGYVSKRKDGTDFIRTVNNNLAKELFRLSPSYRTKACNIFPKCQHLRGKMSNCTLFGTIKVGDLEYPKARIPKEVFESQKLAKEFLKIYASCDGGVSVVPAKNKYGSMFLVRKVLISVKHPILNSQITELLRLLGYEPSKFSDQIRLAKRDDLEKFRNEIGFIKGCKVTDDSKFLSGLEKNVVLNMILDSYKNPRILLDFLITKRSSFGLIRD